MITPEETWEEFEVHCEEYLNALLDGANDVPKPLNWNRLIQMFGYDYIGRVSLHGGHDNRTSDLEILNGNGISSGWWIEAKKRSAQCGQIVVQVDDNGTYQMANPNQVYKLAEDDEISLDKTNEEVEYEPWSDDILWVDAYNDAVQKLFDHMNGAMDEFDNEEVPVNILPEDVGWDTKHFADGHLSCEVIKEHYRKKGVCFFISKMQGHKYADDECFVLIPLEELHNYVETWAEFRQKASGSSDVSDTRYESEAKETLSTWLWRKYDLDVDSGDFSFDIDEVYGRVVVIPSNNNQPDCRAIYEEPGNEYRYKLLFRYTDEQDRHVYQIRQLSNSERPTIVFKMRMRNDISMNDWIG